jgi:hypothetical protein
LIPTKTLSFIAPFILIEGKPQPDPAAYHPNDNGYHAYADAISAALHADG